ncbi:hypothetical protein DOJK_01099 [Patescibacteria group bacterium]|nr:hypothetical protein DOJK_01099 [Patescibacteria group bacterium]
METNLLVALSNLVQNPITDILATYNSSNRINNVGEALEYYVRDLFCNTVGESDSNIENKILTHSQYFSYIGNQNNPPDVMIRGGDAIEVKKIEGVNSGIALNSSYPKDKLYADSPMITNACRTAENWTEKDLLYVVGVIKDSKLKKLWFVYGDCYAANKEVYERISNKISQGLNELKDVEFGETNELARVNRVDPLGITYLRVRGMWGIENPHRVFNYVIPSQVDNDLVVNAIMLKTKYESFPESDRKNIENKLEIKDVKIKSPNNPANLLDAKVLSFRI